MQRVQEGFWPEHLALEARQCTHERKVRLRLTPTSPRGVPGLCEDFSCSETAAGGAALEPSAL